MSLLGSAGGWPQMATEGPIDTISYVNTLLHPCDPTAVGEVTIRMNWATNTRARSTRQRSTRTTAAWCCQGSRSSSRKRTLSPCCRGPVVQRRSPRKSIPSFGIEQRFPFFGYNTLFNVSGNVTKLKGAHTIEGGPLLRARQATGGTVIELQREFQFQ